MQGKGPLWTLSCSNKAISGLSYNPQIPNFLATGSVDKNVKLWDITNTPQLLHTFKAQVSHRDLPSNSKFSVFTLGFYPRSGFILAAGGQGQSQKLDIESGDRLQVWNTKKIEKVAQRFENKTST